ncbi:MAG: PAS domain S-box protein [Comamonas sp.]|nr:PAS domain S-box protein [Comamonas sp.]
MSSPPVEPSPTLASHSLYRSFFHGFVDEIYLHDETGVIVDINKAACSNLAYTREELLGKTLGEISVTLDAAQLHRLWDSLQIGPYVVTPNCHRRKDGSLYHLEVHISCQEIAGRKFYLAVARRTDEKRRQLQLAVSEVFGKTDKDLYPLEQALAFQQNDLEVLLRDALIEKVNLALPAIQRGEYAGIGILEEIEADLRGSPLHGIAARALSLTEELETQSACDCFSSEQLLGATDQLLYQAKTRGRNRDVQQVLE